MKSPGRWASVLLALLLTSGCAGMPGKETAAYPQPEPANVSGVVFVADGAGGLRGTTHVLEHLVAEERLPLRVEHVEWSHGTGRFLADHFHWSNVHAHGRRLAVQVRNWHQRYPEHRIYFVGQSAGSAVVLLAAAGLPEDSVERIILLAPSVSTHHDLRPALTSARQGVDVFYSGKDWFVLGLGSALGGTTDRGWPAAAGRVGFQPIDQTPRDKELYARLRQHAWEPRVSWTGHTGGHYGADCPGHVRAYVLPLLTPGKPESR